MFSSSEIFNKTRARISSTCNHYSYLSSVGYTTRYDSSIFIIHCYDRNNKIVKLNLIRKTKIDSKIYQKRKRRKKKTMNYRIPSKERCQGYVEK